MKASNKILALHMPAKGTPYNPIKHMSAAGTYSKNEAAYTMAVLMAMQLVKYDGKKATIAADRRVSKLERIILLGTRAAKYWTKDTGRIDVEAGKVSEAGMAELKRRVSAKLEPKRVAAMYAGITTGKPQQIDGKTLTFPHAEQF